MGIVEILVDGFQMCVNVFLFYLLVHQNRIIRFYREITKQDSRIFDGLIDDFRKERKVIGDLYRNLNAEARKRYKQVVGDKNNNMVN